MCCLLHLFWGVILAVLCFQTSAAQSVCNIRNIDGLNGENVNKIVKDSHGLIWLGTDYGVSCYTGRSVINFTTKGQNSPEEIKDIVETEDGKILVVSDNGVFTVRKNSLSIEKVYPEIHAASSICLIGNRIFTGTKRGVYECLANGKVRMFSLDKHVMSAENEVFDICPDDNSHIWAITPHRLVRLDINSGKSTPISLSDYIQSGSTRSVEKVRDRIFIGTSNMGLLTYRISTAKLEPYKSVEMSYVNDLTTDHDSVLFVSGDHTYKVNVLEDRLMAEFGKDNIFGNKMIYPANGSYTAFFDDSQKMLWLGYFLEGFAYNYEVRHMIDIYRNEDVDTRDLHTRSFFIHDDDLMIGMREGMYHVKKSSGLTRYYGTKELGASVVTDITWFCGQFVVTTFEHGIRLYNPKNGRITMVEGDAELKNGNFSCAVASADSSTLFISGSNGIYLFDRQMRIKKHLSARNSELPNVYIPEIFLDKQQKLWIGTMVNLCIYDPATEQMITKDFPENFFNDVPKLAFSQADDGDVIAFAQGRIFKTKTDLSHFDLFDLNDNPGVGNINFVVPLGHRFLIGTTMGLFLFDKNFKEYVHFSEADNLPSLNFNKQQYQFTDDGTLWIANCRGLLYMSPEMREHLNDSVVGKVILDRLMIDRRECNQGKLLELFENPEIYLTWNFGSEQLAFKPLLLNYAKPVGRYFEYQLDESNTESVREGEMVEVNNLSLGTHRIMIRLAGHPETAVIYKLVIMPSWLFWFELLFVIVLAVVVWMLFWLRKRQLLHKHKLRQKHQIEQEISAQSAVRKVLQQQQLEKEAYERKQEELRQQRTSGKEFKELQRRVKDYMELEHPWRDVRFRLAELAKAVNSSPTRVSLMLNQNMNTNFYDFVNRYRLDEFKELLKSGKYKHLTMLSIAEKCGFKKTTFFAAFKKFEGCTPNEWIKKYT